jgi:hypothetical protein
MIDLFVAAIAPLHLITSFAVEQSDLGLGSAQCEACGAFTNSDPASSQMSIHSYLMQTGVCKHRLTTFRGVKGSCQRLSNSW